MNDEEGGEQAKTSCDEVREKAAPEDPWTAGGEPERRK